MSPFFRTTSLCFSTGSTSTGASPSWWHAAPASAASAAAKTTSWPSAATLGTRTVTQDPAGSGSRLCGRLGPSDNTLDPLSCVVGLQLTAWRVEFAQQGGLHITIGGGGDVHGVSFGPDWQVAKAKELLEQHVLILTAEGGQLVVGGEGSLQA